MDGQTGGVMAALNGREISFVDLDYVLSNTRPLDTKLLEIAEDLSL